MIHGKFVKSLRHRQKFAKSFQKVCTGFWKQIVKGWQSKHASFDLRDNAAGLRSHQHCCLSRLVKLGLLCERARLNTAIRFSDATRNLPLEWSLLYIPTFYPLDSSPLVVRIVCPLYSSSVHTHSITNPIPNQYLPCTRSIQPFYTHFDAHFDTRTVQFYTHRLVLYTAIYKRSTLRPLYSQLTHSNSKNTAYAFDLYHASRTVPTWLMRNTIQKER